MLHPACFDEWFRIIALNASWNAFSRNMGMMSFLRGSMSQIWTVTHKKRFDLLEMHMLCYAEAQIRNAAAKCCCTMGLAPGRLMPESGCGFPARHGGAPSYHQLFIDGIFHEIHWNTPSSYGRFPIFGKPHLLRVVLKWKATAFPVVSQTTKWSNGWRGRRLPRTPAEQPAQLGVNLSWKLVYQPMYIHVDLNIYIYIVNTYIHTIP